eukprot:Nk52_evm24s356 gene=Nk52_evmTU24s356
MSFTVRVSPHRRLIPVAGASAEDPSSPAAKSAAPPVGFFEIHLSVDCMRREGLCYGQWVDVRRSSSGESGQGGSGTVLGEGEGEGEEVLLLLRCVPSAASLLDNECCIASEQNMISLIPMNSYVDVKVALRMESRMFNIPPVPVEIMFERVKGGGEAQLQQEGQKSKYGEVLKRLVVGNFMRKGLRVGVSVGGVMSVFECVGIDSGGYGKGIGKMVVGKGTSEPPEEQLARLDLCGEKTGEEGSGVGIYRVEESTSVSVDSPSKSRQKSRKSKSMRGNETPEDGGKIGYSSIGGLGRQLGLIRELIELPLMNPGIFVAYGMKPPRGVLLYGPPGTGKTLIAKAVASETGCKVFTINGPEIISKFYGETEGKIREVFRDARLNAPAIVFIDEIDSLCPKRDGAVGESEKRIVASLLTEMDGIGEVSDSTTSGIPKSTKDKEAAIVSSHVVVIGATNRPNAIDSALRRPGRFDREIEIGVPNSLERREILKAILAKVPNDISPEEVNSISDCAHAYVGADLSAVVKEAGLSALYKAFPEEKWISGAAVDSVDFGSVLSNVKIKANDLRFALGHVKPSGMRELMVDVPTVRWEDIGGQDEVKRKLKEAIEWPLKHPEIFEKFKISPPKGIMFYGPPGCSKTLMAKALATESGLNFISVKGPELFSKWVGESEKAVRELFRKARLASPSIVFFDEIDAISIARGSSGETNSVSDRVLSQLLNELDGVDPLNNVVVIAATNRPDVIDTALLRPGRIDKLLYIGPPDFDARKKIFHILLDTEGVEFSTKKVPCADDVNIEDLCVKTEGYSGAEVASVVREASLHAIEEEPEGACMVCHRHFIKAIEESVQPQITKEMLDFYDSYRKGSGIESI